MNKKIWAALVAVLTLLAIGAYTYSNKGFKARDGNTFVLAVGKTTSDGPKGISVRLNSITPGQFPYVNTTIVSASTTFETYITNQQKTWNSSSDTYSAGEGAYLEWSAKYGSTQWPDSNSPTGIVLLEVLSIDIPNQTVTFKVKTEPLPSEVNNG